MIDEETKAQASRYVLGTLPLEQVREFEAAVRADLKLQLLVKELAGTARSKTSTLARMGSGTALLGTTKTGADVQKEPPAEASWMGWMPWAMAACFAILCIALISIGHSLREQALSLNTQLEEKNAHTAELQDQVNQLEAKVEYQATNHQSQMTDVQRQIVQRITELNRHNAAFTNELQRQQFDTQRRLLTFRDEAEQLRQEKKILEEALAGSIPASTDPLSGARLAVLRPTGNIAPNAFGSAVWTPDSQRGLIVLENLPLLPPSQGYQLWLIDPRSPNPISAGFLPDKLGAGTIVKFTTTERAETVEGIKISLEPRSGSVAPTRVVLSSN